MNSLVLCHSTILRNPGQFDILKNTTLVDYVDNNMLIGLGDQEVASTTYSLVRYMWARK